MMDRKKILVASIHRWWKSIAAEREWSTDNEDTLKYEAALDEAHEQFYAGEIKLSDVHAVFDGWVMAHDKAR